MKLKHLLGALVLSVVTLPLFAQVNDTYVIPAVANVPGAFGTHWMSQLSIFNPQTYPLRVSVTFVPTLGGQATERLVPIPANSVAYADNLLSQLYGQSGTGALLVAVFADDNPSVPNDVLSRAVLVTSNTYNDSTTGTYGQTIPGTWTGLQDYQSDGISAIAHGIRNVAADGWRTNIGAVNLGRTSVTMNVTVYDADGRTLLANAPFVIPPMAHLQDRLPIEVDGGSVEFTLNDPSNTAVVFPYTSTIDQFSGDPTYQTPTLLASARTLYGKKGTAATATLTPGRVLDNATAHALIATANRTGKATLAHTKKGLQIQ
jgi:hypothetical protein